MILLACPYALESQGLMLLVGRGRHDDGSHIYSNIGGDQSIT